MESIAALSMSMSQANIATNASISVLKRIMQQSTDQMTAILEGMEGMENLAPLPESNIDISI